MFGFTSETDKITIEAEPVGGDPAGPWRARVRADRAFDGRAARLTWLHLAEVRDERPVPGEVELHGVDFRVRGGVPQEFELPAPPPSVYAYRGIQLTLQLGVRVVVDDGYVVDSKAEVAVVPAKAPAPAEAGDPVDDLRPPDPYSLFDVFQRYAPGVAASVRPFLGWYLGAWGLVVALGVGSMAAVVVTGPTSDGSMHPFVPGVIAAFMAGMALVVVGVGKLVTAVFGGGKALAGIASPKLDAPPGGFRPGRSYPLREHFTAPAPLDLPALGVRVVAMNCEAGCYRRGSGTNARTVAFRNPVRGMVLYEAELAGIEKGEDVALRCEGDLDVTAAYAALYPPSMCGESHGLTADLELQLIVPDLPDVRMRFPDGCLDPAGWDPA